MAVISYSSPLSAISTNNSFLRREGRAEFQTDIPKTEELVRVYIETNIAKSTPIIHIHTL